MGEQVSLYGASIPAARHPSETSVGEPVRWTLRLGALRNLLSESLWFIPAIALALAVIVAELLPLVEERVGAPFWFSTDAESARALLGAIATATLTLTGLVFSVTMLVLQLASSQLSPRVMRRFLRDRSNQIVLALFISTFAYALLALRNVENGDVPTLSVWLGFAMAMVSVVAFVHYIDHMAQSIRPSTVVSGIGEETRTAVDRMYPDELDSDDGGPDDDLIAEPEGLGAASLLPPDATVAWTGRAGIVIDVDVRQMAQVAETHGLRVVLRPLVGDFLPSGATAFDVWGELNEEDETAFGQLIIVGRERTMQRDASFGIRQLVDIAERALSPGVNDPTTAVQAIDQVHEALRTIARRKLGPEVHRAEEGPGLAIVRRPTWEDFVALGIDELRLSGRGSLQVNRRLRHLLDDVMAIVPPYRQPALRRQIRLLEDGLPEGFSLSADRERASRSSARGHGS